MKIKERFEKHVREDVKERILDSRLTPVVIMAVATIVAVNMAKKQPTIIIHNHWSVDREVKPRPYNKGYGFSHILHVL